VKLFTNAEVRQCQHVNLPVALVGNVDFLVHLLHLVNDLLKVALVFLSTLCNSYTGCKNLSVYVNLKHEARKKRSHTSELFLEFAIANLLQHLFHHGVVFHNQSLKSFQQHLQHGALHRQIFQQLLQPIVLVRLVPHVSSHSLRQ
jgi:hypothetical protein